MKKILFILLLSATCVYADWPDWSARDYLYKYHWTTYLRNVNDTTTSLTARTLIADSILGGPAGGGTYIAWQGISGSAAQIANYANGYGVLNKNYSTVGPFSTWENNSKTQCMLKLTVNDTNSVSGSLFSFDDGGFPSATGGTELVFGRITRSNQICYGTYVDSGKGYYVDVGHNGMGAMWESNDNATAGSILNYYIQDWTGGGRGRMIVARMQGNPAIPLLTVSGDNSYGDSCMVYRWGVEGDTLKARAALYLAGMGVVSIDTTAATSTVITFTSGRTITFTTAKGP